MSKKNFFVAICAMIFALSYSASAQQPKKVSRIGYLSSFDPASDSAGTEAILLALREVGYVEGQNIATEYRYAEGSSIDSPSLRPSWCASRLISSWYQEGSGRSGRP
jgi:putative ABC transport system substrate-binding protein